MKTKLLAIFVLAAASASADSFVAQCEDVKTVGFRSETDLSGNRKEPAWSYDEKFSGGWRFAFNGSELELDGKPMSVVHWDGINLIAADLGQTTASASLWVYAINLNLKEAVGSQVNTFSTIGNGLKTRSVQMACKFSFAATPSE